MAVGLRCGLQGTIFAQDIHDDALDTGLGRPPIGKVPMTGAERVRLYRLKHAAAKPVPKPTADNVAATIDECRRIWRDPDRADCRRRRIQVALATYRAAVQRWPNAKITLRNRARVIDQSWRD